jgi:hypothetical protein
MPSPSRSSNTDPEDEDNVIRRQADTYVPVCKVWHLRRLEVSVLELCAAKLIGRFAKSSSTKSRKDATVS